MRTLTCNHEIISFGGAPAKSTKAGIVSRLKSTTKAIWTFIVDFLDDAHKSRDNRYARKTPYDYVSHHGCLR